MDFIGPVILIFMLWVAVDCAIAAAKCGALDPTEKELS